MHTGLEAVLAHLRGHGASANGAVLACGSAGPSTSVMAICSNIGSPVVASLSSNILLCAASGVGGEQAVTHAVFESRSGS